MIVLAAISKQKNCDVRGKIKQIYSISALLPTAFGELTSIEIFHQLLHGCNF
jgi:hypothetical protein